MAPFEVLYGWRCRTPLNWIEPGEKVIFGPDIVEEAETIVHRVQENLKAVKSRQETYANKRRRPLAFEVGDHVYLRISSMKGVKRFGVKEKLAPRYIGSFPNPWEVWNCGVQARPITILSWSSRHVSRVTIEEMLKGTCGHRVAGSDTARGWLVIRWASNQGLGLEGSCHEA
jgi:hypothetical protein